MNVSLPFRIPVVLSAVGLLLLFILTGLLAYYDVSKVVTSEDQRCISRFLRGLPATDAQHTSYANQVALLMTIQQRLLRCTPNWRGIPQGHSREPEALFRHRGGLCYDRSRALEKIFMFLGFQTRHLALYPVQPEHSALATLFQAGICSHAVSEVLTRRGWLVVDSNSPWLSLTETGQLMSMKQMGLINQKRHAAICWECPVPTSDDLYYRLPCVCVYGLYSRHGRFYPPYTAFLPDFNLRELLYNI